MIYRIPAHQHHAWPPPLALYYDKKSMKRVVTFDITSKYDLPGEQDDLDVNKLFGWGYFNGGHHTDSVRFGWLWNQTKSLPSIYAYCYVGKVRVMNYICEVPLYTPLLMTIDKFESVYSFTVSDPVKRYFAYGGVDVPYKHNKKFAYKLGVYFGGNNPAPHEMEIKIVKP